MQVSTDKINEIAAQIQKMMYSSNLQIQQTIEKAFSSGALSETEVEYLTQPDNHVLAKILITAYFNKRPFQPLYYTHKKLLKNLELFL
jgi:hypothetical protein